MLLYLNPPSKKGAVARSLFLYRKLQLGLDLGGLAHTATEVVQLCTAYLALADRFNLDHVGGVNREHLFHTYAIGDTANSEGLVDTARASSQ